MTVIVHLDADKRKDVVHFQRHIIGNYIRLLTEDLAHFTYLAEAHDEWTARLAAEARQPPKDEAERLRRVRDLLACRNEFYEDLFEFSAHDNEPLSVRAGSVSSEREKQHMPPRPSAPYRVERTRNATAHLDYFTVRDRHGSNMAEMATLEEAEEYISRLPGE